MQNPDPSPNHRSWLERLSQALLREPRDREQLVELLRDAEQRDLLDAQALAMIEGVLQVSEMQVSDIMVPRTQMVSVSQADSLTDFLPAIIESGHSRFPVLGEDRDEVVGILLAKDLLRYTHSPNLQFNIRDVIRPVVFVPESKRLNVLLQEFRIKHNHMAIVVDEYGGIAGLVTIEDVLEQIVGEIEDEYDINEDEEFIKKYSETQYTVKALTPIVEFNKYFNSHLSDTEFDTVGGIVMHAFGHLPKRSETVIIEPFRFKVINADNRRIRLLRVTKRPQAAQHGD